MISRVIRQLIEQRFGNAIRYPKECEVLASQISQATKATISASTLKRLLGFVKATQEPRMYTLDILANYLGFASWEKLITSFDKENAPIAIEKLKPEQVKKQETVIIGYALGKSIALRKTGGHFEVILSSERKIMAGDIVRFNAIELHYPLTFSEVLRQGDNLGRMQVAVVSGITFIKKML